MYSKWPEVVEMKKINAEQTIEKLRKIFTRLGLPKNLVLKDLSLDSLDQKSLYSFVEKMVLNWYSHHYYITQLIMDYQRM